MLIKCSECGKKYDHERGGNPTPLQLVGTIAGLVKNSLSDWGANVIKGFTELKYEDRVSYCIHCNTLNWVCTKCGSVRSLHTLDSCSPQTCFKCGRTIIL